MEEVADLLLDVATALMGAGSHTSRVVKSVSRMAQSFGYEMFMTVFQKNMTMMIRREGDIESITLVRSTKHIALNFNIVSELSALSWRVHDDALSVEQARHEYEKIMAQPRISRWVVLLLVAAANSSFCRLFEGDLISCALVFCSTLVAFYVRQELMNRKFNHHLIFVIASMITSLIASLGYVCGWGSTPDIAIATSVLFLIPGVPLINSMMDVLEGHVLTGISRFVNATMLVVSIAIGILATMIIIGIEKF